MREDLRCWASWVIRGMRSGREVGALFDVVVHALDGILEMLTTTMALKASKSSAPAASTNINPLTPTSQARARRAQDSALDGLETKSVLPPRAAASGE